jgi:hypothetical protein
LLHQNRGQQLNLEPDTETVPRHLASQTQDRRRDPGAGPVAEVILACDFLTVDLLDGTQAYVLAAIEHASRRIRILGITLHPTGEWTAG